ncbi:MAG TPA: glycosyltransferase family 2 protein, partial [Planctomycetota bacterium]|nr:glycosyltransferase family 2 protein [Planctomycetota bacterium]
MTAKPPPKPPPPPAVSVVVVNFNGGDLTPACLESLPAGVETIVVDNGSTDGSADTIAARFPQAILIRNGVNRGFAGGVNRGLEVARGRYVCLLNNDARLSAGALETLVAYMDAHPDVGMAAPQLLHEDGRKQHSFDNFPSLATVFLNKSLLRLLRPSKYPSKRQDYSEPRDVESVIGACMMVRRSLIDRIGPLDEAYFLFLEETDWCLRAWRSGARVAFVPQAAVVHLQGRTRDKVRVRARIEYTRSLFTYFRKNRPGSYLLLRALFPLRTLVALLAQTLTLFLKGVPKRWTETAAVLGWQLAGGPPGWGLSTAGSDRVLKLRDGWTVLEPHMDGFGRFDDLVARGKVVRDETNKKHVEVLVGERTYLVKIYKGTSLVKKAVGSKASREFAVSRDLVRAGIPCAPIVAWGDREYGSAAVVEKVPGA